MLFVTPQWGIKHIKHLNARAGNMPNTSIASLGDAVKHTNKGIYYIYIYFFFFQKNSRTQWKSLIRGRTALGSKPSKDQYVCHSRTKMLKGWGFASSPNNVQMSPFQVHESILFIAYWISYHFLISYVRASVFPFTSLQLCRLWSFQWLKEDSLAQWSRVHWWFSWFANSYQRTGYPEPEMNQYYNTHCLNLFQGVVFQLSHIHWNNAVKTVNDIDQPWSACSCLLKLMLPWKASQSRANRHFFFGSHILARQSRSNVVKWCQRILQQCMAH